MQIIKQLYEIALRKREPADLNYSLETAIILTMTIIFLRYVSFAQMESLSSPAFYAVLSIIGELALIYALLKSKQKNNRFVQTVTALFGVTLLMSTVILLVAVIPIVQLTILFLMIWSLYLMIVILRSALDCSTPVAILLTIAYNAAGYLLVVILMPKFQTEMLLELDKIAAAYEQAKEAAQQQAN